MAGKLGTLAVYLTADSKGLERGLAQATSMVKRFAGFTLAALGVNSLKNFAMGSVNLYGVQEQNEKKLERVLTATGHAAGLSAKQLKDYASELQGMTTTGDEEILKHQSLLLAFTGVTGNEFKRATALALDMSEVIGNGVPENIKKLGRSLQEPLSALTGLAEIGVKFSVRQQEQIKALVAAGRTRQAQLIILAELEKRYGGAAAAAADTTGGRIAQMKNAWGDLKEEIGRVIVDLFSVKDSAGGMTNIFSEWAAVLKKKGPEIVFAIRSVWIEISAGVKMLWATVSLVVQGIGDLLKVVFTNMKTVGLWVFDSIAKLFVNMQDITKSFVTDTISALLKIPTTLAKLWPDIVHAAASGNYLPLAQKVMSEVYSAGKDQLAQTIRNAMKAGGIASLPKLEDIDIEKLLNRFGGIDDEWKRIERERGAAQENLKAWLEGKLNPKPEPPGKGANASVPPAVSVNVMKMVTTAARGSLEAYQARYNTGKDFENQLLKLQKDQLAESRQQTAAIGKLGANGLTLGLANVEGVS
ncbi:MAG: phage tail tape measure protein [Lentisphaeria bacterium]|nr:phage tail tape measure protein [Lentisphaeria bacterium]